MNKENQSVHLQSGIHPDEIRRIHRWILGSVMDHPDS